MRSFLFVFGFLITGAPAAAKAAWDISPRWICQETHYAWCKEAGPCERSHAQAIEEIDFQKMTLLNFSGGPSTLGVKRYVPPTSVSLGVSYFASDGGQMWAIFDKPLTEIGQEGAYAVRAVTLSDDGGTLYWGECRPR